MVGFIIAFNNNNINLNASIGKLVDLVDTHKPMLCGKSLLKNIKLEVLEPDLAVANTVITRWLAYMRVSMC